MEEVVQAVTCKWAERIKDAPFHCTIGAWNAQCTIDALNAQCTDDAPMVQCSIDTLKARCTSSEASVDSLCFFIIIQSLFEMRKRQSYDMQELGTWFLGFDAVSGVH